jgi:signal transduction histidine kinase
VASASPPPGTRHTLLARTPSGLERRPVAATIAAVERDPTVAAHALIRDLSEVVRAERAEETARTRLMQADRLSTLGTLAGGVAHEINNPAAFILLGLDLLDRIVPAPGIPLDEDAGATVRETLHEMRESIRRIVDITRDLRLFARAPGPDGQKRALVDVNRTVESALSLTRSQILERAQIDLRLEEVPPVMLDDGGLGQVVVNLLVNAAQAIPRSYAAEDHRVTIATRSDGHTVEIEVEDTGAGIPAEIQGRIWQPFFSTKSPEVGTGFGLSISRDIVERAGGTIAAESPAARYPSLLPGSRFVVRLPAAGAEAVEDGGSTGSRPAPP